jgi:hypothetical protein
MNPSRTSMLLLASLVACTAPGEPATADDPVLAASEPAPAPKPKPLANTCDSTGPPAMPTIRRLAADSERRLLAVEVDGFDIHVFETRCWTRVAAFAGSHPQFIGRELAFIERGGAGRLFRWDPDSDALAPVPTPDLSRYKSVLRGFNELLIAGPGGTIALWRDGTTTPQLSFRQHLCGFGFLTETTAYAVSSTGRQTIWDLESGVVLDRVRSSKHICATVAASDDGRLAIADGSGKLSISEAPNQIARPAARLPEGYTRTLVWDGPRLYIGGEEPSRAGIFSSWKPGDARAEPISRHPDAVTAVVVSEAWVAVGLAYFGYFTRRPDEPIPLHFPPATHLEVLPRPLTPDNHASALPPNE